MTIQQMEVLLNGSGIRFVYHSWKTPPKLPYGVFLAPFSNNFSADGVVYQAMSRYQIELYTAKKDPASEAAIERVLADAGLFWEKMETYIDTEKMFQILYECEV